MCLNFEVIECLEQFEQMLCYKQMVLFASHKRFVRLPMILLFPVQLYMARSCWLGIFLGTILTSGLIHQRL